MELYKYTDKEKETILKSMVIIVDTREQVNDHIKTHFDTKSIKYVIKKLDYGDYSFYIPKNDDLGIIRDLYFDKKVTVERKHSLEELSGNLTNDRERFEKELKFYGGKMYLLIENANYHDIVVSNYKTQYKNLSYLAGLHSFSDRYDIPTIFIPKQEYSGVYIYNTLYYFLKNYLK